MARTGIIQVRRHGGYGKNRSRLAVLEMRHVAALAGQVFFVDFGLHLGPIARDGTERDFDSAPGTWTVSFGGYCCRGHAEFSGGRRTLMIIRAGKVFANTSRRVGGPLAERPHSAGGARRGPLSWDQP